ncbi:type II toxin-antitoxin system HipA family toxin [Rhodohalobacter barkolensis]|uniref:Toxin HipA n=1 Tax=Rhodohalobacter barkolensis TaxID=2053187 RepID=A0A2N0VHT9_9BACT|nr:HipA domain-containing protein [Rhodohalobacter barkolensis]PKD43734.1 toxin HipA [Rhodohalobacter barkolensis]
MDSKKTDIIVYAHWQGMSNPVKMGILSAQEARGHLAWSFAYDEEWLNTRSQLLVDPDLEWFTGPQYSKDDKPNFGMFLDSMPDTWGRTLMKKREALLKPEGEQARRLTDIDYLLGVYDPARMGGLRFKLQEDGPFLDNNEEKSIPPITDIRELQVGADLVESDEDSEVVRKWLKILLAPGSSLGGARPKSSVLDENGELWIAKFPSRQDTTDMGAWEYVAWSLARSAGITVPEAKVEQITGKYHTFFSKRFDRTGDERVHFASAMTMTGHFESGIRDQTPSYLELAEFIQFNGASPDDDLHELWRRIVFNIAISNTDDHLRNHGFIITDEGWRLSPAYDMNPSIDKAGLALNIDLELNTLDYDIAKSVGVYFNLNKKEMDTIIEEVQERVSKWEEIATNIGIPLVQRRLMEAAFNVI